MKTEKDFNGYWARGIKTHKGHEGESLIQCSIYKDGKRIGFYSDGDWGGPSNLMEFSKEDEKEFTEYCKTISSFDYEPWADVVYQILEAINFQKWLKRQSKNKTLFKLKNDKDDGFRTIGMVWKGNEKKISDYLNNKYGDTYYLFLSDH